MSSGNPDLPYWLAFARCLKVGPKAFALLRSGFPTMREAWTASERDLKTAGLESGVIEALKLHREQTDVNNSLEEINRLGLEVITITDSRYPKLLKEIYDPPAVLFTKGDISSLEHTCLAVVGSRLATNYGLTITKQLVSSLAQAGLTIISGLAYGIDTAAHRAALEVQGKTVAVMASGLDDIYPKANWQLAQQIIAQGGLWLSEFPPHTAPLKQNFPFRNRIIAGLAQGTLVIEAAKDSGALLTAKHALEANREVMAVPGNASSPLSVGTNELLKQGAHLITSSQDVLAIFGLSGKTIAKPREPLNPRLQKLLEQVPYEPTHLETLIRELKLPASALIADLTLLELKGYLADIGGNYYKRLM
jgi:DNA processing protein